jgi:hypothetical protein
MIDNLTFEISKRILANIGAFPDSSLAKRGIADDGLLLDKSLTVRYDDGQKIDHNIYCGKISLDKSELKGLLIDLSVDKEYEFLFVFRFDSMPIHCIKVAYNDMSDSFIRIFNDDKDKWIVPSVYMQARLLADFERFVSWGLLWDDCTSNSDLYDTAIKLIN